MQHVNTWLGQLRQGILGLSAREVAFAQRGFWQGEAALQHHLEQIGMAFLHGYHAALRETACETLAHYCDAVAPALRGFAYEGAAMGLYLLDTLTPWYRQRFRAFLHGPGAAHSYIVHVGAGWALALCRRRLARPLARLDPLLGWLAVDGYGFYHGYFHWPRAVTQQRRPRSLTGYACRVFDQGLGRSLWFVDGADVARLPQTMAAFPRARQADLWSGVGLACAYAGCLDQPALLTLRDAAGVYAPALAQGAAFAAQARQQAGNPADHTALACTILCGVSATAAAQLAAQAQHDLPSSGPDPAYEVWRQRLQAHFAQEKALP